METCIEDFRLNFSLRDNAPKTFLEIKWLLDASLRRIEFNKSERRNSYDRKNHHRSSHCIILYAGIGALSQEHPEHPEHPKAGGARKRLAPLTFLPGIKKNITAETSKSDGKFHVKYEGQDLALDLIKGPR